jgi:predicted Zn-dependent protease
VYPSDAVTDQQEVDIIEMVMETLQKFGMTREQALHAVLEMHGKDLCIGRRSHSMRIKNEPENIFDNLSRIPKEDQ